MIIRKPAVNYLQASKILLKLSDCRARDASARAPGPLNKLQSSLSGWPVGELAAVGIGAAVGAITVSSRGPPRHYLTVLNLGTAAGMLPLILLGNTSVFPIMAAAAVAKHHIVR